MPEEKLLTPDEHKTLSDAITEKIKTALAEKRKPDTDTEIRTLIEKEIQQNFAKMLADNEKRVQAEAEARAEQLRIAEARQKRRGSEFSVEKAMQFEMPQYEPNSNRGIVMPSPFTYKGLIQMKPREVSEWKSPAQADHIKWAQQMNDRLYILGTLLAHTTKMPYSYCVVNSKMFREYLNQIEMDTELRKAINVTTTGEGLELVPTGMSGRILELIELKSNLMGLFRSIPMPTNPYEIPIQTGHGQAFIITESVTDTPSDNYVPATTPPTGDFLLRAKGIGNAVYVSYRATEDAIIAVIPYAESEMVDAIATGLEQAIMSGDDSATHQDSDTHAGSAKLPQKLWKGLRYYGLNAAGGTVDFANGDPTKALLGAILLKSKHYASMVRDLVWIPGSLVYTKMRLADIGVFTLDQYGQQAVVLTGELAQWSGIPIVPTPIAREDLNASGVYDGVTTNRATLQLVQRQGFLFGTVGTVLLETARHIRSQQIELVASRWLIFKAPWDPTNASYPFVSIGVNLKTTA